MNNLGLQTHQTSHPVEGEVVREAVGFFSDYESLQNAVRDLEGTEFPRQDISVLGNSSEIEKNFGVPFIAPQVAEDIIDAPRQSPVRPEEKTIGRSALIGGVAYVGVMALALAAAPATIPATIAVVALGGGAGAAIGGGIVKLMEEHTAKNIENQIAEGGLLLWVRTPDAERERIACEILAKNGASQVKVHEIR